MKYGASLLVLSTALFAAHAAEAQQSNFSRDRNIAVGDRIPTEYEPRGLRLGVFDVSPSLDVDLNSNDNVFYDAVNEQSDTYVTLRPQVQIASDWGRHRLTGLLRATTTSYSKYDSENTSSWEAAVAGRLDVHGNSNIFGGVNYSKNYEPRYDPSTPQDNIEPIQYDSLVTNLGFVAEGNRLRFTGALTNTDLDYKNGVDVNGNPVIQDFRDYSRMEYKARVDYAFSPDTALYAVYIGNKRDYDLNTSNRDSTGYDAAIGASFDLTNLIRGEAQIGYQKQEYDNPLFTDVDGVSFLANVQYFPTQLITVSLDASRTIQETPYIGASGYTSTASSIGVDYELLRTLVLSASYGFTTDDYNGLDRKDDRTEFLVGGRYLVNRNVVIRAGYVYSENRSKGSNAIAGYKDNAFKVSLGLQY
jgi:hypothetical protein